MQKILLQLKAESSIWKYFRFRPDAKKEPDYINVIKLLFSLEGQKFQFPMYNGTRQSQRTPTSVNDATPAVD